MKTLAFGFLFIAILSIGFFIYYNDISYDVYNYLHYSSLKDSIQPEMFSLRKELFLTEVDDTRIKEPIDRAVKEEIKSNLEVALKKANQEIFNILLWAPPSFYKSPNNPCNSARFNRCGSCCITTNKSLIDDPNTKAVLFHVKTLQSTKFPEKRRKDQYYVWYTMESPASLSNRKQLFFSNFDEVFNLTMSHRRDSDITLPYVHPLKNVVKQSLQVQTKIRIKLVDDLIANKSKLAIWIVSNCNYTAGARLRMKYVDQLIKSGLNLDRKGACFPPHTRIQNINEINQYKFYLSFENSWHCKDYITEKLSVNAFEIGTVPVVFGAKKSDYEALVPPGSYIYAEDFESPKHLVQYLNYLDKNETAYRSYMNWRTMENDEMPMSGRVFGNCQLCRVLHGINIDNIYNRKFSELRSYIPLFGYPNKSRVVPSLTDWFFNQENKECLSVS